MPADELSAAYRGLRVLHDAGVCLVVGFVDTYHPAVGGEPEAVCPHVQHREHRQYLQHVLLVRPVDAGQKDVCDDAFGDDRRVPLLFGFHVVFGVLQALHPRPGPPSPLFHLCAIFGAVVVQHFVHPFCTRFGEKLPVQHVLRMFPERPTAPTRIFQFTVVNDDDDDDHNHDSMHFNKEK